MHTLLLASILTCIYISKSIATTGWNLINIVEEQEDDSCPDGEVIPCNNTISTNNTILRYERGNLTHITHSIPSKECPWRIRAPPGTTIYMRTTCYYHFHVSNLTEYSVCFALESRTDKSTTLSSICGGGYTSESSIPVNEVDYSVYYSEGHTYGMGFTTEITFVGEPDIVTTDATTSPTEVTTSRGYSLSLKELLRSMPLMTFFLGIGRY